MIDTEKFIAGLHDYIGKALTPIVGRIKALEDLQTKTIADAYCGVWASKKYTRGALVTHNGSLWLAVQDAEGKPGESHCWTLVVKRGRDAT